MEQSPSLLFDLLRLPSNHLPRLTHLWIGAGPLHCDNSLLLQRKDNGAKIEQLSVPYCNAALKIDTNLVGRLEIRSPHEAPQIPTPSDSSDSDIFDCDSSLSPDYDDSDRDYDYGYDSDADVTDWHV